MTSASFTARDPDGPPPGLNRQRRVTQSTASIWNRSAAAHSPPNIGYVGQGVGVALQKGAWPRGRINWRTVPCWSAAACVRSREILSRATKAPGMDAAISAMQERLTLTGERGHWPRVDIAAGRPQPVPSGRHSISADPVTRPSEVARLWVCDADVQRSATRWRRLGSMASARVIAGRMVVSRRASIDFPAPGGPRRTTLWAERRHHVHLHLCPRHGRRGPC